MKSLSKLSPKIALSLYADRRNSRGYIALIAVSATIVITSLLAAYYTLTRIETLTSLSSANTSYGFDAAEAGLNLRAEDVRSVFLGFNVPSGTSPLDDAANTPCEAGNNGTDDFACNTIQFNNYDVTTYLVSQNAGGIPDTIRIPPGDAFEFLSAQEYRYSTISTASRLGDDEPQAILQMVFRSRLIPLFQFAAFYDKDLEILPGPVMTLSGRVHTNANLFVNANNSLNVESQGNSTVVTVVDNLYRGRKNNNSCGGTFNAVDAGGTNYPLTCNGGNRREFTSNTDAQIAATNDLIDVDFVELEVPDVSVFNPDPSAGDDAEYWVKADLRLVLNTNSLIPANQRIQRFDGTNAGSNAIEIRNVDGSVDTARTQALNTMCMGNYDAFDANFDGDLNDNRFNGHALYSGNAAYPEDGSTTPNTAPVYMSGVNSGLGYTNAFRSARENSNLVMMDVNLQGLLECIHSQSLLDSGRTLDDTTEGGLVFHMTVADGLDPMQGKTPGTPTYYAVRVYNGEEIASTTGPAVEGLTIVTDQAVYIAGNYNSVNKVPASFLADSLNVLSSAWDVWSDDGSYGSAPAARDTTINAAFLAGTDTTGGADGPTGFDSGDYNGGLENYPRFHENWGGDTLTYRGSFVSLDNAQYINTARGWNDQQYSPPARDWNFDQSFLDSSQLPPLSPRFVLLRQDLFVRDFSQ